MKVFVQTDDVGKKGFGAEGNAKDDRVIATGLCIQGIKEMPRQKKPENIAETRMREWAQKNGLPMNFNKDEPERTPFPADEPPRPSSVINHRSRPNVGMR